MIADRSHSTSRVTVRGPAQSRTHGQDLGHGQALLSDPPNGTALHTALHTHDPTRSHSCTCPEWRGSQCYFKGYGEAEAACAASERGISSCSIQRQATPRKDDAVREELARARVDEVVTKTSLVVVLVDTTNSLLVDCHEL